MNQTYREVDQQLLKSGIGQAEKISHELVRSDHRSNTAVAGGAAIAVPKSMPFKSVDSAFDETVCRNGFVEPRE